jgi:hypothetical protein
LAVVAESVEDIVPNLCAAADELESTDSAGEGSVTEEGDGCVRLISELANRAQRKFDDQRE